MKVFPTVIHPNDAHTVPLLLTNAVSTAEAKVHVAWIISSPIAPDPVHVKWLNSKRTHAFETPEKILEWASARPDKEVVLVLLSAKNEASRFSNLVTTEFAATPPVQTSFYPQVASNASSPLPRTPKGFFVKDATELSLAVRALTAPVVVDQHETQPESGLPGFSPPLASGSAGADENPKPSTLSIRPVLGSAGTTSIPPDELRYYPVPKGGLWIHLPVASDYFKDLGSASFVLFKFAHLGGQVLFLRQLLVGSTFVGFASVTPDILPQSVQDEVLGWNATVANESQDSTALYFVLQKGLPVPMYLERGRPCSLAVALAISSISHRSSRLSSEDYFEVWKTTSQSTDPHELSALLAQSPVSTDLLSLSSAGAWLLTDLDDKQSRTQLVDLLTSTPIQVDSVVVDLLGLAMPVTPTPDDIPPHLVIDASEPVLDSPIAPLLLVRKTDKVVLRQADITDHAQMIEFLSKTAGLPADAVVSSAPNDATVLPMSAQAALPADTLAYRNKLSKKFSVSPLTRVTTRSELLDAAKLLDATQPVLVVPEVLSWDEAQEARPVHDAESLSLYTFPQGPAFIYTPPRFENNTNRVAILLWSPAAGPTLLCHDEVTDSWSSSLPASLSEDKALNALNDRANALNRSCPRFPALVELAIGGEQEAPPLILAVSLGTWTKLHIGAAAALSHAQSGSLFSIQPFTRPPANSSVWDLVSALDSDSVFRVGGRGVLPLNFSPAQGATSWALIIAKTPAGLRRHAKALVRACDLLGQAQQQNRDEPVEASSLLTASGPTSMFRRQDLSDPDAARVWCFSTALEQGTPALARAEISARSLALLRPESHDRVFLDLGAGSELLEFWEWARPMFGLVAEQALWVQDPSGKALTLDRAIAASESTSHLLHTNSVFVPYSAPTTEFMAWAGEPLASDRHSASVFCGTPMSWDDIASACSSARVKVMSGRVVSNDDELSDAWTNLSAESSSALVVIPMKGAIELTKSAASALTELHSVATLDHYDFSMGPARLVSHPVPSTSADGMPLVLGVAALGKGVFGGIQQAVSLDRLGLLSTGFRPLGKSVSASSLSQAIYEASHRLLEELDTSGPSSLIWVVVGDELHLRSLETGHFSALHFPLLFAEMYAQDAHPVFSMVFDAPSGLDVSTFWTRLLDAGLAFIPGASKQGLFPLTYIRGAQSTILMFAASLKAAARLRSQFLTLLLEPVTSFASSTVTLSSFLDDSVRRVWAQSPRYEYRKPSQWHNLPHRALALVRPRKDVIILPGGDSNGQKMVEFMEKVLKLEPWQIIFTSGANPCMDLDIDDESILATLKGIVSSSPEGPSGWAIVPYTAVTPQFQAWASALQELGVSVVGETPEWSDKYGNKAMLHRHISRPDEPSMLEVLGAGKVRIPRGWVCDTTEELLQAYESLTMDGKEVVIKPVIGAAGEGIMFPQSAAELQMYNWSYGQVLLEEKLALDCASDGIPVSPAAHYFGADLYGEMCDQIMSGTSYTGWRASNADQSTLDDFQQMVASVLKRTKPNGPGGFDALVVDGKPYLTDINTARFNGAHFPKILRANLAPDSEWVAWKMTPGAGVDVWAWWRRMRKAGLALVPGSGSTRGVFPMLFRIGAGGQFVAFGKDLMDVGGMVTRTNELLSHPLRASEFSGPGEEEIEGPDLGLNPAPMTVDVTLVKGASALYNPEVVVAPDGTVPSLVLGGKKVLAILSESEAESFLPWAAKVVDVGGSVLTPGFVDIHVHLAGGGGEMGPRSRTPEALLSELIRGGLTTVVGVQGTDTITRNLSDLLAVTKSMRADGLSAYMYTGGYPVPTPTLTGSVDTDLVYVEEVIGVGEIALSDHRGTQPSTKDMAYLVSRSRVGGMISGKSGVVYVHIGSSDTMLKPLWDLLKDHELPITSVLPTHLSRSQALVEDSMEWVRAGGYADFTAAPRKTIEALKAMAAADLLQTGRVAVSSDAYGSMPTFDDAGKLVRYSKGSPEGLRRLLYNMSVLEGWALEDVLPLMTRNPASMLKLDKGTIAVDKDGDILALDPLKLTIRHVWGNGEHMMSPSHLKKGMHE